MRLNAEWNADQHKTETADGDRNALISLYQQPCFFDQPIRFRKHWKVAFHVTNAVNKLFHLHLTALHNGGLTFVKHFFKIEPDRIILGVYIGCFRYVVRIIGVGHFNAYVVEFNGQQAVGIIRYYFAVFGTHTALYAAVLIQFIGDHIFDHIAAFASDINHQARKVADKPPFFQQVDRLFHSRRTQQLTVGVFSGRCHFAVYIDTNTAEKDRKQNQRSRQPPETDAATFHCTDFAIHRKPSEQQQCGKQRADRHRKRKNIRYIQEEKFDNQCHRNAARHQINRLHQRADRHHKSDQAQRGQKDHQIIQNNIAVECAHRFYFTP